VQPTVCDANAILGYLNPRRKLGGEIALDRAKAEDVFAPLARTLGVPVVDLALGVLRVADATMARALNKITVERGVDGRGATLLAFGGMGPMHAVGLARSYGMSRVLVPAFSSAFSALGCVAAETSYTRQRTLRLPGNSFDTARLASVRGALAEELQAPLLEQGYGPEALVIEETALIRYRGQSYAVDVAMTGIGTAEQLAAAFEARHQALFGFASGEAWELLGLRVRVRAPREAWIRGATACTEPAKPFATDLCWFAPGEPVPTPRYDRAALSPGDLIRGPAIIEDDWSTTVVPPGWQAAPDERGSILLTAEAA
jgi:N-methylhydantoinase A